MNPDSGKRNCNSQCGKQYHRRQIRFAEECIIDGRTGATVPVYDNMGNLESGDHSHHSEENGDCHIVGRRNLTKEKKSESQNPRFFCEICREGAIEPTTSNCGHIFCRECIDKKLNEMARCPLCKSSFENKIRLKVSHGNRVTSKDTLGECPRKVWLAKSFGYLKEKVTNVSETLLSLGNSVTQKTYKIATTSEFLVVFSVGFILFLLFWFGFLPKIRVWEFIVDLLYFIKNYQFLEQPEEPVLNYMDEHKTIFESKLPGSVGYHPKDHRDECNPDSIFQKFMTFLSLV